MPTQDNRHSSNGRNGFHKPRTDTAASPTAWHRNGGRNAPRPSGVPASAGRRPAPPTDSTRFRTYITPSGQAGVRRVVYVPSWCDWRPGQHHVHNYCGLFVRYESEGDPPIVAPLAAAFYNGATAEMLGFWSDVVVKLGIHRAYEFADDATAKGYTLADVSAAWHQLRQRSR
jgi:hypothetical protein